MRFQFQNPTTALKKYYSQLKAKLKRAYTDNDSFTLKIKVIYLKNAYGEVVQIMTRFPKS